MGHPRHWSWPAAPPHALQIDRHGTIYVADRENGRIEIFNPDGTFRRELPNLGRVYALRLAGPVLWATTQLLTQEPGAPGAWLLKLDSHSGTILGHLRIPEARAGHALDLLPSGEPVITLGNGLLWFHAQPNTSSTVGRSPNAARMRK